MRIESGYSRGTVRVQQGYSQGTAGVQWGIVGTSRGTVVVGGRIYRESIKITQKLVNVFYIYCNIQALFRRRESVHNTVKIFLFTCPLALPQSLTRITCVALL